MFFFFLKNSLTNIFMKNIAIFFQNQLGKTNEVFCSCYLSHDYSLISLVCSCFLFPSVYLFADQLPEHWILWPGHQRSRSSPHRLQAEEWNLPHVLGPAPRNHLPGFCSGSHGQRLRPDRSHRDHYQHIWWACSEADRCPVCNPKRWFSSITKQEALFEI